MGGAFVGHAKEFKFHSAFRGKLVTDFHQGSDVIGLEFSPLCWLKDTELIGRWPEKWSVS